MGYSKEGFDSVILDQFVAVGLLNGSQTVVSGPFGRMFLKTPAIRSQAKVSALMVCYRLARPATATIHDRAETVLEIGDVLNKRPRSRRTPRRPCLRIMEGLMPGSCGPRCR